MSDLGLFAIAVSLYAIGSIWEFRLMRRRIERLEHDMAVLYSNLIESITTRFN